MVDSITYKGIVFRRYPNSKNYSDRMYYRPNGTHVVNGVESLHREIWKDRYGEIPEGVHIHHKDGNPLNNDISNLECVSSNLAHQDLHGDKTKSEKYKARRASHLEKIRPLAAAWHSTEEGLEAHGRIAREFWDSKEVEERICVQCGSSYETRHNAESKFCSNNCKSANRRSLKLDHETRTCVFCGNEFEANRYLPTKTCSNSCAAKLRWQERRENGR